MLVSLNGSYLHIQRNLGIGNHGRKKKCMGMAAHRTINTDYGQSEYPVFKLNVALIGTMADKTS